MVVYDDCLDLFSGFTSLPSSCCPPFCPPFDFQPPDYFNFSNGLFGTEPPGADTLCPTPAQDDLQFLPTPNQVDSSFGPGDWFSEAQDWASDDLVFPPWAQSDTTVDHLLDFNNTPDPFNIDFSSTSYETPIDSDSLNSAELHMLPDSDYAETPLVPAGNSPTYSDAREGTTGSPEYEPERTREPARPNQENVCQWPNCFSRFDQVSEFRRHVRSHAVGGTRCLWAGCVRLPESSSSLKKHLDTHIKPHICPRPGCRHRAAKARDIRRHASSHGLSKSSIVFYCPASDCPHNEGGAPFTRADNGRRHMKQKHPGLALAVIARTHRK